MAEVSNRFQQFISSEISNEFFPQDLLKRQSNKHLNLLLLIKCVINAEKRNITFYVFSYLSGSELDSEEYTVVYRI